jgi:amino acid adenylation domain-containing protein
VDLRNLENIYPLSPQQEDLLLHAQQAPCGQFTASLKGELEVGLLEQAWREAGLRCEALRTFFAWKRVERPLQLICRAADLSLAQLDWNQLSAEAKQEQLVDFLRADFERDFDPTHPPLVRLTLCRMAQDEWLLVCTYHRLVLDHESLALILDDVFATYKGLRQEVQIHLPARPSNQNYIAYLQQEVRHEEAESFWKDQLKDVVAATQLPIEGPAEAITGFKLEVLGLPEAALPGLARDPDIRLGTILAGAWALLLSRYSNEEEVVFGITASSRPQELQGSDAMIGSLLHTLPLRVKVSAKEPVLEWLKRLQQTIDGALSHQHVKLSRIREWTNVSTDNPLFESSVVLDKTSINEARWEGKTSGFTVREVRVNEPAAPLTINLTSESLQFTYDTRRFDKEAVRRLLDHLAHVLDIVLAGPEQRLEDLPLLSSLTLDQLLYQWNDNRTDYPRNHTLQSLFEEQVEQIPEAVALEFGADRLTYRELNRRANQLAHYLQRLGIVPEVPVGLYLDRSIEMIVALLGILKAGGAYMPLDIGYPLERLEFMIETSQTSVLVTREGLGDTLPAFWGHVVCVDSDWETVATESEENPVTTTWPDNLAYLMFTSGSTGTPKAISVTHRNVVRLVKQTNFAHFAPEEVFLQLAPISFDASTFEIWGSLLNGARLVIMPPHQPSLEELGVTLRQSRVTTLWLTAGLFNLMVNQRPDELKRVKQLLAGGDVLSPPEVRAMLGNMNGGKLINGYGPTESTTFACCYPMSSETRIGSTVPIGRPISNTQVYLLDKDLKPMPVGAAGELYIGGDGLARGYYNRPELTAERFVPHPFSEHAGDRLYRTGDLARYRDDGVIEFLGRRDNQVKVRGFRIELGEIEVALGRHPAVQQAVVVARSDNGAEKQLVAYVVLHSEAELSSAEMRSYLKEHVPEHMIPPQLVLLDAWPLTPNGKVDRAALPSPASVNTDPEPLFAVPTTPEEKALAETWIQVLNLERVGIDENFFDLGGDSIRSLQIRALAQKLGYDFSIKQLFQRQTIAELAKVLVPYVEDSQPDSETQPFALIRAVDRDRLPDDVVDAYPLARLQLGMLFHSELSSDAPVYIDIFNFHLRTRFDFQALRSALQQLTERHPILRTSFDLASYSEPLQLVHESLEIPLSVIDLRHASPAQQDETLAAWVDSEKRQGFPMQRPPYLRLLILLRGPDTFQFSISFHHALLDGWSFTSTLTELFTLYYALLENPGVPLVQAPLKTTFSTFVALEREALASEDCRSFWSERLAEISVTTLPPPTPAPLVSERLFFEKRFEPEFLNRFKRLARLAGVPLKSVLLAAYLRTMAYITGSTDVTTGVVFNGRPEGEDGEQVRGLFLNTLPFSLRLTGGTWMDLLSEVRDVEARIMPFRRYPLAELQHQRGGRPLFEMTFNFVHFHVLEALEKFEDLEVLDITSYAKTNFPFAGGFQLNPETQDIVMKVDYDSAKFPEEQVVAFGRYVTAVLESMTADPYSRYDRCDFLSAGERQQLLSDCNDTAALYPQGQCLHQLFEIQARRTPDAVAVVGEGETLTYAELDARSSALGRWLRAQGVGAEQLVGVYLTRTPRMIVALLGILKAGGAYLPLDVQYPAERLGWMLSDARVGWVLTEDSLRETVAALGSESTIINLDQAFLTVDDAVPEATVTSANLAYVIYTSGSTGKPKGAMLTHDGVVNCLYWMQETYGLTASDSFLMKTSLNFDPSVWEIFWPLWIGARVVLARPDDGHLDPEYLVNRIIEEKITSAYFVPSMLDLIVKTPGIENAVSLRRVISGGEKLSHETIDGFFSVTRAELHHSYGPTETSIAASEWSCERNAEARIVNIGRPLANTQLYVLDDFQQPVPPGAPGELFIGGVGVGRGYLRRPELTAERFVPDPFGGKPGTRLYRTGDLVRYLPNGNIEFLGRRDFQVKIRGYRIEPGEVELALRAHEEVSDCVVQAIADGSGGKRLAAYVTFMAKDSTLSASELRSYLKKHLPDHMVPATITILDALPLMPNGKIDRAALPAPEPSSETEESYVSPLTAVEELLSELWSDVLGVGRASVAGDFFELGGNSLLATQLVSRIREVFRVEMPLRQLFERPTIRSLAELLQSSEASKAALPAIVPIARDSGVPLSFAQMRLWFLYQLEPDSSAYNIPTVVRLTGFLDVAALERALSELLRRHESLRTTFTTVNGVPQQVIAPAGPVRLTIEDLSRLDEHEREQEAQRLIGEEIERPFDLEQGPVLRVAFWRLGEEEHLLALVLHHIVSDAWSRGVLVRELSALYESFVAGEPSPLAELDIQYADFAHWQRAWLTGEIVEKQLAYWKQQLGGRLPALNLPTDMPPSPVQGFRGAAQKFNSLTAMTEPLKALSRREGVTLFMTLLAALKVLLHHYTEQSEIAVGATLAGRNHPALEQLVGFFVNTVVMCTDLSGDPTFRELQGRVRQVSLGAYAHQDVPIDRVLEELRAGRERTRNPLEVAFTLDNTPRETVALPGLTVTLVEVPIKTTRLNLVLALTETPHGLTGSFQYNVDLFNASTIARMIAHYELLLRNILAQPDIRVSELRAILDDADRQLRELRQNDLKSARQRMVQNARTAASR